MKLQLKALSIALGAATLMAGSAWGEATVGVGTGTIATARVNVAVVVPHIILLRVGSGSMTVDTATFTASLATPSSSAGSSQDTDWAGAVPTFTVTPSGVALSAAAWTNSGGGGSLACGTVGFVGGGGPSFTDVTVATSVPLPGGSLAHPGANIGCGGSPTTFARNTVVGSTWTYAMAAGPFSGYASGTHNAQTTYTATQL